jgi:hypothetical protein
MYVSVIARVDSRRSMAVDGSFLVRGGPLRLVYAPLTSTPRGCEKCIQKITWGAAHNALRSSPDPRPLALAPGASMGDYGNKELCSEKSDSEDEGEGDVPRKEQRRSYQRPSLFCPAG